MPPKIGFLEIAAVDPDRAAEFFRSVFGWSARRHSWSGGAHVALVDATGDIGCALVEGAAVGLEAPTPVVHVESNSQLDLYLESVVTAGGEVIETARPIDEQGSFARFRDTEGNVWGLWAPAAGSDQD